MSVAVRGDQLFLKTQVLAQLDAREEVKDPDKPNTAAPVQPKITEPPVSSTNQTLKLEVEQLRKELANLKKKENTKLSPRPSPPSIPVTTHNKALADFGDNLKQLEEDKKKLFKDLEASRQQTTGLQKDLQSKNTANKTLETNLETSRKAAADLQKLLDAKPETVPITQHNKELADLKKVLKAVTKAKTSLEAEGKTAKTQLAKVNESARKLGNDLKQAIAERDAAKGDLKKYLKEKETIAKQFAKEKKGLMVQVDLLQKQSSEETMKIAADLQKELTKEQVNAGQMQKDRERQKKEIDFLNKELANLEGKLLNLLDSKTKVPFPQNVTGPIGAFC